MRAILYLFFLFILQGCCTNVDYIKQEFTATDLAIVPYQKNDSVKFITNTNTILKGIVADKSIKNDDTDRGTCTIYSVQSLRTDILFENENKVVIFLNKIDDGVIWSIPVIIDGKQSDFTPTYVGNNLVFETITFQNQIYQDAVLLRSFYDQSTPSQMIYSKTHGIEYILFEDGSWYKRID